MIKELFELLIECLKSPIKYVDRIITSGQTKHQLLLLALIGVTLTFDKNLEVYLNGQQSLLGYLAISIFLGGIFGWMGLYFYSYAVGLVGVFFGSKIDTNKIINIMAYSYVPILLLLFVSIMQLIIFKIVGYENVNNLLVYFIEIIKVIINICCFIFIIIGISRVQGLSYFKGFLTMIIPILTLFMIIYGLILVFK
jgi:hypothetical protein